MCKFCPKLRLEAIMFAFDTSKFDLILALHASPGYHVWSVLSKCPVVSTALFGKALGRLFVVRGVALGFLWGALVLPRGTWAPCRAGTADGHAARRDRARGG